jgi:hypothetical protein
LSFGERGSLIASPNVSRLAEVPLRANLSRTVNEDLRLAAPLSRLDLFLGVHFLGLVAKRLPIAHHCSS